MPTMEQKQESPRNPMPAITKKENPKKPYALWWSKKNQNPKRPYAYNGANNKKPKRPYAYNGTNNQAPLENHAKTIGNHTKQNMTNHIWTIGNNTTTIGQQLNGCFPLADTPAVRGTLEWYRGPPGHALLETNSNTMQQERDAVATARLLKVLKQILWILPFSMASAVLGWSWLQPITSCPLNNL